MPRGCGDLSAAVPYLGPGGVGWRMSAGAYLPNPGKSPLQDRHGAIRRRGHGRPAAASGQRRQERRCSPRGVHRHHLARTARSRCGVSQGSIVSLSHRFTPQTRAAATHQSQRRGGAPRWTGPGATRGIVRGTKGLLVLPVGGAAFGEHHRKPALSVRSPTA